MEGSMWKGVAPLIRTGMRLRNELDGAFRSAGIVRPSWDLEELLSTVNAQPDLRTYDNPDRFEEGLTAILKAARQARNTSWLGRFLLTQTCKAKLQLRRRIALAYEQFPEVRTTNVERPLIITGL